MAAEAIGKHHRPLQVDGAARHEAAECGPHERLGAGLKLQPRPVDPHHRQAAAARADALAEHRVGGDRRGLDRQTHPRPFGHHGHDLTDGLDQAGEHG
jgi:hypothetical protein